MEEGRRTLAAGVWRTAGPLLLWALHFAVLYVGVAAACTLRGDDVMWAGRPAILVALAAFSAAWIALLAAMLLRAWRDLRRAPQRQAWTTAVRAGASLLALVAVAWASVPLWFIAPCAA